MQGQGQVAACGADVQRVLGDGVTESVHVGVVVLSNLSVDLIRLRLKEVMVNPEQKKPIVMI